SLSGSDGVKKPVTRESTAYAVKPLRREGRSVSAEPVCSCAFLCYPMHTRPRVRRAPGPSLRPLGFEGANEMASLGQKSCRENDDPHLVVPANAGTHTPCTIVVQM